MNTANDLSNHPVLDFRKEELHRCIIHTRVEILALLNAICEKNLLVTVMVSANEFFVTTILELDERDNTVILDCAQNPQINQLAIKAGNVALDTMLDKIRISLKLGQLAHCKHEGRDAFEALIPESLIRLQRRENFRVAVPVMHPVECVFVVDKTTEAAAAPNRPKIINITPADISFGGMGLFDDQRQLDDAHGSKYENCRINLPGVGIIYASVEVLNSQEVLLSSGIKKRRIGCGFINLSNSTGNLLQRYITLLEREQNAKRAGLV